MSPKEKVTYTANEDEQEQYTYKTPETLAPRSSDDSNRQGSCVCRQARTQTVLPEKKPECLYITMHKGHF